MLVPLNEDEAMVLDSVHRLAERWKEEAHARDESQTGAEALRASVAELGLFALLVSEEAGGAALGRVAATQAVACLAAADAAGASLCAMSILGASVFDRHGHEALASAMDGSLRLCASDAAGLACVFAASTSQSLLFLSDKQVELHTSFDHVAIPEPLGLKAATASRVTLKDVDANVVWPDPLGIQDAQLLFAAVLLGTGRAALKRSVAYAQDRKQFGKSISSFQAIQWKLADVATALDGAALLIERAARTLDRGEGDVGLCPAAKLSAGEAAVKAAYEAVQIHGGNGFIREYEVERYARDAQMLHGMWGASRDCLELVAQASLDVHEIFDPSRA